MANFIVKISGESAVSGASFDRTILNLMLFFKDGTALEKKDG